MDESDQEDQEWDEEDNDDTEESMEDIPHQEVDLSEEEWEPESHIVDETDEDLINHENHHEHPSLEFWGNHHGENINKAHYESDGNLTPDIFPHRKSSFKLRHSSIRQWSIAISVFGGVGLIFNNQIGYSSSKSVIVALTFSILVFSLLQSWMNYLYSVSAYYSPSPRLRGRVGKVIIPIPKDGIGQVELEIDRQKYFFMAQHENENQEISSGESVQVVGKRPNSRVLIVKDIFNSENPNI